MNASPSKNHAYGINLAVAQVLTEERKARGITNEALAASLPDVSYATVQRYLSGKSAINVEVLNAICAVLGISDVDVIKRASARAGGTPPRPPEKPGEQGKADSA